MKKIYLAYWFFEFAYWVAWVPFSLHIYLLGNTPSQKTLFVVLFFLLTRLPRFVFNPTIGKWVDGLRQQHAATLIAGLVLLFSTVVSLMLQYSVAGLLVLVVIRSISQGILEIGRVPAVTANLAPNERAKLSGLLDLQPNIVMGVGSAIGGYITLLHDLTLALGLSLIFTIVGIFLVGFRSVDFQALAWPRFFFPLATRTLSNPSLQKNRQLAERFFSSLLNGSNPLLVNLWLLKVSLDAGSQFASYMVGIAAGCTLAFVSPLPAQTMSIRFLSLAFSFVFQLLLLIFIPTNLSLILLATGSVFFQFVFFRMSTAGLVALTPKSETGSMMALLSQVDIAAAFISHAGILFLFQRTSAVSVYLWMAIFSLGFVYLLYSTKSKAHYATYTQPDSI